ncbi:MAG: glycoside hydrolase family 88 protein [Mangrovibacterium sp.]
MKRYNLLGGIALLACTVACSLNSTSEIKFDVDTQLQYCEQQALKTLKVIPNDGQSIPRNIAPGSDQWNFIDFKDWCSGFWGGELWYLYENSKTSEIEEAARKYTEYLKPLSAMPAIDHDLGFQVFNTYGNGYRLTGDEAYKQVILATADTLATLYNPNVGTILSWPRDVPNMEWPQHNTIMDNMINLEMLLWASKNGGDKCLYDIAVSHADVTMKNAFRDDYTSYHVVVYNRETGEVIKKVTHQGYADDSMWARGQSWAIYGYTMMYRETKEPRYLDFAQKVTNVYLDRLPEDLIPYWDFNAPDIPNAPRDASAACVVASALLELSTFVEDENLAKSYFSKAEGMLKELSTARYQSRDKNTAALLHSTGHYPAESEIDYSIIYADYYYAEALMRYKKMMTK